MDHDVRILIVDDSHMQRLGYARCLETAGFIDIEQAANGLEAVLLVNEQRPDIVVMDLMMDLMDGISAIKYIKAIDPGVAIVVHSENQSVAAMKPYAEHVHAIFSKDGDIQQQGQKLVSIIEDFKFKHWRDADSNELNAMLSGAVEKFNLDFHNLLDSFTLDIHRRVRRQLHCRGNIEELRVALLQKLDPDGIDFTFEAAAEDKERLSASRALSQVVDRSYFQELMESVGGAEMVRPMVEQFSSRTRQIISILRVHLTHSNQPSAEISPEEDPGKLAHELAGMCASFAAIRAREDATRLHQGIKETLAPDVVCNRLDQLVESLEEAYGALNNLMA